MHCKVDCSGVGVLSKAFLEKQASAADIHVCAKAEKKDIST